VAYTFRDLARGGCSVFTGIRPLAGRPAADLLVLLESRDAIETGVGLACANALANRDELGCSEGDILEQLEVRPEDDVAMVGHFGPLVEALRERARSLTIYERVAEPTGLLRPRRRPRPGSLDARSRASPPPPSSTTRLTASWKRHEAADRWRSSARRRRWWRRRSTLPR
jgi:hypothetical protein